MRAVDRWSEVFETLQRNKLRTFLTACGVFWGVFMLVVMLGFGQGLETGVMGSLGRFARNAIYIWTGNTTKPYKGHAPNRPIKLSYADTALLRDKVKGVTVVAPRSNNGWGSTTSVSRGDKSESFSVSGDIPEFLQVEALLIDKGRFLNPHDLDEFRKVAVIGQRVQDVLFATETSAIGKELKIRGITFTVIGVFHSESGGERADFMNGRVFTPRTTFNRMNGKIDQVDYFTVLVDTKRSSSEVETEALALMRAQHQVHPDDPGGIESYNSEKDFRRLSNLFLGISSLSWFVGVMTLLAGAIGVSNILMISINERTKEFGIRKAIGATPASIITQVIEEAIVLTGAAGGLGLCAGVGVLAAAQKVFAMLPKSRGPQFFAPPDLDLGKALIAVAILTVAGAFAGLAPARSAVAIKPTAALAHD